MSFIDTSVLVDVLRGSETARSVVHDRRGRGLLHTSEICAVEVLAGMRRSEETATRRLLDSLQLHPVDRVVAERAGELGRRWLPSHSGIDAADLVVAATALILQLDLLTVNVRHFPMFHELAAPYGSA